MRKLSIEKMSAKKDVAKIESVVGASFERSKKVEDMMGQTENKPEVSWYTVLICFK